MKRFTIIILISIIHTAFVIPTEDYRDGYTGNYVCVSRCVSISSDLTELIHRNDTATISVTKNLLQDSILTVAVGGQVYQMKLNNNRMSDNSLRSHYQGLFFSEDSISFSWSSVRLPTGCSYKGIKQ